MALTLTTIGVVVSVAFESEAGVRPTTGYKKIPQVKSIPEMDSAPDTLETTSFDNLEFKSYVDGLKDLGGVLDFTANYTQELFDLWQGNGGVMEQWDTAKNAGKAMYVCIDIPGLNESCYVSVSPSKLGLPGAEVNAILEATIHLTPVGEPIWASDPIYDGTTSYNVTVTGYVVDGVAISVLDSNNKVVSDFVTGTETSEVIKLAAGDYTFIGRKSGVDTQVLDETISANATVQFDSFAE